MKKKKFSGFWATFEFLDDLCDTVDDLRRSGYKNITVHTPCPRHEIDHSLGNPRSKLPIFTIAFGSLGVITAYTMTNWMTLDWVLPVSAKPLATFIPYTVIAFELMVLLAIYGTIIGMFVLIGKDTIFKSFPQSSDYKNYTRFTVDRFGLIVRCSSNDFSSVKSIVEKYLPEEVYSEEG